MFQIVAVKRGRGRPRRNPPPGSALPGPIPAFIIPSPGGQAVMMAPLQVMCSVNNRYSASIVCVRSQCLNTAHVVSLSFTPFQFISSTLFFYFYFLHFLPAFASPLTRCSSPIFLSLSLFPWSRLPFPIFKMFFLFYNMFAHIHAVHGSFLSVIYY